MHDNDWISRIEKGDVIEDRNGTLRVVRAVSRFTTRRRNLYTSVTLAIRRPSWTTRPYTVINSNDLRQRGFKPTGAKWPLDSEFDRRLEDQFGRNPRGDMSAWDVLGVA
jgi:signal peptidase I